MSRIEFHVVYENGTYVYWGDTTPHYKLLTTEYVGDRVGPSRIDVQEETPITSRTPNYNTVMGFYQKIVVSSQKYQNLANTCGEFTEILKICMNFKKLAWISFDVEN